MTPDPCARDQRSILVRHFLRRFFDSELVPRHADARVTLIQILALMSIPGLVVIIFLLRKYAHLPAMAPGVAHLAALDEKCLFLYFSMVAVGLVVVLEWDTLFPDRRDYLILMPLPIKSSTIFISKAGALCIFLGVFSLFVNAMPMVLYPLFFSSAVPQAAWVMFSQALSTFAGNAFIFCACIAVQGLWLNVLGPKIFMRISRMVQRFLLVFLLTIFILMPAISYESMRHNPTFLAIFPPAWFLGLYQTLLMGKSAEFSPLAAQAVGALALAGSGFALSYMVAYKRLIRKTLELGPAGTPRHSGIRSIRAKVLHFLFLRDPRERASFCFIVKTLTRSPTHRTIMGASFGAGLVFVAMGLITLISRHGLGALHSISAELLSIPLVLNFFVLLGMRGAFALPVNPGANWIFQVPDGRGVQPYLSGARKVMVLAGIVLPVLFLFPLYAKLGGWLLPFLHAGYFTVLSLILIEILNTTLDHMPCTCLYMPGKANLKLWCWIYLLGFINYAYTTIEMEQGFLRNPRLFVPFFFLSLAIIWMMVRSRR